MELFYKWKESSKPATIPITSEPIPSIHSVRLYTYIYIDIHILYKNVIKYIYLANIINYYYDSYLEDYLTLNHKYIFIYIYIYIYIYIHNL